MYYLFIYLSLYVSIYLFYIISKNKNHGNVIGQFLFYYSGGWQQAVCRYAAINWDF